MSQNNQSSNAPINQEEEISLLDILLFLRRSWIIIAVFGAIGLAIAIIYLLTVPKQYQAIAQIQMAQISATNNISPAGVNIEDPSLLMARMSFPTSFAPATITACGLDGKKNAASILAKSIKLSQPKGTSNVVELKTTASNPDLAEQCANAIYELIKTSQEKIVSPYIEEARLVKAKDLVLKADKSGSVFSAVYLSTRDEIRYLLDEITALQNVVISYTRMVTRFVAPIYVSDAPISPKKRTTLTVGLFGGLVLGLLIALGRQLIPKIKAQLASNPQF